MSTLLNTLGYSPCKRNLAVINSCYSRWFSCFWGLFPLRSPSQRALKWCFCSNWR